MPAFLRNLAALALIFAAWPAHSQTSPKPKTQNPTPTFARDIAPIVYKNCVACHRAGDIGPFPLTTYDEVKRRASLMVAVTQSGAMPPFKPREGFGEFHDARRLTAAEKSLLKHWVDAKTPAGDLSKLPPLPKFPTDWALGEPDLILTMEKPFTIPAEGDDIYQHFVFSLGAPKERYLRAIEVRPGNRRIAHHAVGILDSGGTARKLDAATPEPGYRGMGGGTGFLPAGFTPGYIPGQTIRPLPGDGALTLPLGADFVLQMHYHPTGKPETDLTRVGLYFTDTKPTRNSNILMLGSSDIDIAPGDSSFTRDDSFTLPVAATVTSLWAHMHLIGKEVKVWADLPDGTSRPLLLIDDWDFNWQDTYRLKTPVTLPAKTVVRARFVFDNSASNPRNPNVPPARVLNGENSTDEMAGLIVGVETRDPLSNLALFAATVGHYFETEAKAGNARAEAKKVKERKANGAKVRAVEPSSNRRAR